MTSPPATPASAATTGAALLRDLWLDWAERLDRLGAQDWDRPTRCGSWSVRELVAHASPDADALGQLPGLVTEQPAVIDGAAQLLKSFNRPGGVATSMAPVVAAAAVTLADTSTAAELVDRFRRSTAVLAATPLPGSATVPYPAAGTVTVQTVTDVAIVEATVHLLDLIDAVGGPPPATAALVHTRDVLVRIPEPETLVEALAGRRDCAQVLPVLR